MNTADLIDSLAKKMSLPKATCRTIVKHFTDKIMSEVKKGNQVKLTGFGIFNSTKRKARIGRNPQNGTPIKISAKRVPKFKSGKKFRDALNNN
jgi:DNA-binding protein HU-beta